MKDTISCLYECNITHQRMKPRPHRVEHSMFSFYIDLDELPLLEQKNRLIAVNKMALYTLRDRDHFDESDKPLKQKVIEYVKGIKPNLEIASVRVLTNLRFLNYVFNPITVFFCFDPTMQLQCAVAEVGNTFGEKKPYLLLSNGTSNLKDRQPKNFYVSPFINLDTDVVFDLDSPDARLNLNINSVESGEIVLAANMHGSRIALTDRNLLLMTLKYPFVTFFVIGAIHLHALFLWLKKVPFITKEANAHLQTGVLRPYPSSGERQ